MSTFVSIIIPVHNEEQHIAKCLQSIANQDYPKDQYEVLILDGNSTDGTLSEIAKFLISNSGLRIQVLENPNLTVTSGLNLGIAAAHGDVIMRMDAHAFYAPDYISSCLKVMEETGAANVGGHMRALQANDTALAQASMLANDSPFGLGGGKFHDPNYEGFVETVWLGCYPKKVFEEIGLYDERRKRTEDIDLNSRLLKNGYKIYLSPKIKAWYYPRSTLAGIWRQRWADGCEITRFLPDNPKAPRLRHFIPLIFVSSLILLTALAIITAPTPPCPPRCGEGLLGSWNGLNLFNLFNRSNSLNQLAIRLLLLELLTYLGAMLLFVIKAGKTQFKKTCPEGGWSALLSNGLETFERFETVGGPGETNDLSGNSIFNIQNSGFKFGCLALLPVVFVTLHFSYGLGSIWGLVTLPFWLLPNKKAPAT